MENIRGSLLVKKNSTLLVMSHTRPNIQLLKRSLNRFIKWINRLRNLSSDFFIEHLRVSEIKFVSRNGIKSIKRRRILFSVKNQLCTNHIIGQKIRLYISEILQIARRFFILFNIVRFLSASG